MTQTTNEDMQIVKKRFTGFDFITAVVNYKSGTPVYTVKYKMKPRIYVEAFILRLQIFAH